MNTAIARLGMYTMLVILLRGTSYASIEDRFFCSLQDNTIIISLNPSAGRLCNSLSKPLQTRISQLQTSIKKAELYKRYTSDKAYRASVIKELKKELKPLESSLNELTTSVKTFKTLLFKQYYRIMYDDLSKDTQRIQQRIQYIQKTLQKGQTTTSGDIMTKELIMLYQLNALIAITLSQKDFDETLSLLEQIKNTKQFIRSLSAS